MNKIKNPMSGSLFAAGIMALVLLWSAVSVSAQQLGTADEARAMLYRAIAALKSNEATAPANSMIQAISSSTTAISTYSATTFPTARSRRMKVLRC